MLAESQCIVILASSFFQNGSKGVDLPILASYASRLKGVAGVFYYDSLRENEEALQLIVGRHHIMRVILAGDRPGLCQPLVKSVLRSVGASKAELVLLSYDEYGINHYSDPELAKAYLFCAVHGLPYEQVLSGKRSSPREETLIIGAGIAGIQAALEIAEGGYPVYLIEKSGTIGGHMAQFDKTFPTLDCAACILTPKMVEVSQHPNIRILTCSELVKLDGEPGNFIATVLKQARRVDISKCSGCGVCAEKCPSKVLNEFDEGTSYRKAIYMPFPQAVPNKYLVDAANCRYVSEHKCKVCEKVCPAECIHLDEQDETLELHVGNVIVATGFKAFDPSGLSQYGYGVYPNVLTSLEFERMVNASGPTGGLVKLSSIDKKGQRLFLAEGEEPASVAVLHCVGSRDCRHNAHCSMVCCMYSLKLAHLAKEKLPSARIYEFYIDMRAYGKGYEEFYNRIKSEEDIFVIRGRTASITERQGKLELRTEDIEHGRILTQSFDMVVLSVGLEPASGAMELAGRLGIAHDSRGWYSESGSIVSPVSSSRQGVYLAGTCQGPKDIPDAVAQASAAAAEVLRNLQQGYLKLDFNADRLEQLHSEIK
jgi:heterodisulfide reductase subunit A2